jgi:hypothetical protein
VDARHPALRKSASNIHSRWQRTLIWNILRSGAANNQTRILLSTICSRCSVVGALLAAPAFSESSFENLCGVSNPIELEAFG